MADRLDDIFSPERLRARWQQREDIATGPNTSQTTPVDTQNAITVFHRLQNLIRQRFQGEDAQALHIMLDELKELLVRRFAQTDEDEISTDERKDLNLAIEEILNQIEDLLEALEF